jgi:hypothetical protein
MKPWPKRISDEEMEEIRREIIENNPYVAPEPVEVQ